MGITFTASTASAYTIEQIAEAAGDSPRWYQLYWPKNRDLAASFIARLRPRGTPLIAGLGLRLVKSVCA
jgi:lactate 2-monooxygenase